MWRTVQIRTAFRTVLENEATDVIIRYVFPEIWLLWRSGESAFARMQRRRAAMVFRAAKREDSPPQNPPENPPSPAPAAEDNRPNEAPRPVFRRNYSVESLESDLAQIVGLERVKESIRDIYYTIQTNRERKERGLLATGQSLHMVFLGNPGTGKTTVARMVGQMFRRMGLLSKGHFVEAEAKDLIGEYVGHTAPKTAQKIQEALGGVLFIDEAYSLIDVRNPNQRNTFGPEAIAVLIKAMEDHRDNLCVIFAGYKEEMEAFLNINPGMKSRIPFVLEFEDYSPDELLEIFKLESHRRQYLIAPDGEAYLWDLFDRNAGRMRELGNGRFARNVLEAAIIHQARRVGASASSMSTRDLATLTVEDLMAWERREGRA